jgi:serine/threonine protein phosphatase PrpC
MISSMVQWALRMVDWGQPRNEAPNEEAPNNIDMHPDLLVYAHKQRTTAEKMRHQLQMALKSSPAQSKYEGEPFSVSTPRDLPGKPIENPPFSSGVAQHQGARPYQEDRFLCDQEVLFTWKGEKKRARLFGVFDGHGDDGIMGEFLRELLSEHLGETLTIMLSTADCISDEVIANAFTQIFWEMSDAYRESGGTWGATATCLFQIDDRIYCPNVGDSRTILVKPNVTYQLTEDACVSKPRFQKWHANAGNSIVYSDDFRILPKGTKIPKYNMARDVGADRWMCHRPKITSVSYGDKQDNLDLGEIYCQPGCYFVLASDGLYEPATTEEIGREVRKLANKGASPDVIARVIAEQAEHYPQSDNVTVLVVAV